MKAIVFGKLPVQNGGVPVKMGQSFLASAMTSADDSMSVNSASPFCQDMVPFKACIDPTGTPEWVMVKGLSGNTFLVDRGLDDTVPRSHPTGAVVMAKFSFACWDLSVPCGSSGRRFWGKNDLVPSTGAGVIYEFVPNPASASISDRHVFYGSEERGNPLNLTDYGVDADVNGQGMYVVLWVR